MRERWRIGPHLAEQEQDRSPLPEWAEATGVGSVELAAGNQSLGLRRPGARTERADRRGSGESS